MTGEVLAWRKVERRRVALRAPLRVVAERPASRTYKEPSAAQLTMLHRIAAAPRPLEWLGLLFDREPGRAPWLAYTPVLPGATIAVLWELALLSPGPKPGTITLSRRGRAYLQPGRIAYERVRWEALTELSRELAREWSYFYTYRKDPRSVYAGLARPPKQPTKPEITQRVRELIEKAGGRA